MPKSIDQCDAKNDSMSHYGAVSCHDWACRCSHPATVQRHSLCDDAVPASVKPNAYKRGFVLPGGSYLTKHNQLILPETKPPIKTRDPLKSNVSAYDLQRLLPLKKNPAAVDVQLEENRKRKNFERVLCSKPVSVKGAFRVSIPHWQSARFTQRWPWKNTMQCRRWSIRDQYTQEKTEILKQKTIV
ncbi:hypothetical protein CAPTEDRAFT_219111 [Capitella teleta]|uniref:Uncharacterized protein n=1 Tax=Capitella teleta TaxID=283909 RepID=R7TQ37_CAPTE|nr:hypothetical protein CAPTEDRAFT_219111 [Capitella teleta]|eukprot:ELT96008.1 hypothetical protein CAPTEDRAFT_219111 [Capitella teleta]